MPAVYKLIAPSPTCSAISAGDQVIIAPPSETLPSLSVLDLIPTLDKIGAAERSKGENVDPFVRLGVGLDD